MGPKEVAESLEVDPRLADPRASHQACPAAQPTPRVEVAEAAGEPAAQWAVEGAAEAAVLGALGTLAVVAALPAGSARRSS
mmetsp:Transcript_135074/g.320221  ORF Transcript_135074/g.320221 Transcript_135074/m.320221 type:complete len:81 (-) Transcript_135074:216-458(-)